MKLANRKAKCDREAGLNALESFANLGELPEDWRRFRLKFPEFFPIDLTEWFYTFAEHWYTEFQAYPELRAELKPPLFFYRDHLRKIWSGEDRRGIFLKLLLGFEQDVKNEMEIGRCDLFMPSRLYTVKGKRKMKVGSFIPGQPANEAEQTTIGGLPPGKPVVNGVTGAITWEFGCILQQSVYELMQQRWRAMVCTECGSFFLADKTRQTYCSSACFGEMKRKRALDYWNRKGSNERDKRRKHMRRSATHRRSKPQGASST